MPNATACAPAAATSCDAYFLYGLGAGLLAGALLVLFAICQPRKRVADYKAGRLAWKEKLLFVETLIHQGDAFELDNGSFELKKTFVATTTGGGEAATTIGMGEAAPM